MAWVIDTCLLNDIAEPDPVFGIPSAILLDSTRGSGLVVCPVSYVELAPVFNGDRSAQDVFLRNLSASIAESWQVEDTIAAHLAWYRYVTASRLGGYPKRPIADILIGAFSARFEGLLTRNANDYRKLFPALRIVSP